MFFQDNLPVYHNGPSKLIEFDNYLLNGSDGTFYKVLNNGMELQKRISGIAARGYNIDHLPVAHKKNFEKRMIDLNYNLFIDANSLSKFRHKNNYSNHVFVCLYKDTEPYILYNVYENSKYVTIKKDTNFGEYANYTMVCFNDTEQLERKDFEKAKNKMVIFLKKSFQTSHHLKNKRLTKYKT